MLAAATLPRTVQALLAEVPPGEHELQVSFSDSAGQPMPALDQTWVVDVPEEGVAVYYFHSLPILETVGS